MINCPEDVLVCNTLPFLTGTELCQVSKVSRRLNELARSNDLWQLSDRSLDRRRPSEAHWLYKQLSPRDQYIFSRMCSAVTIQGNLKLRIKSLSCFMRGGVILLLTQLPLYASRSFSNPLLSATVESSLFTFLGRYPCRRQLKLKSYVLSTPFLVTFFLNIFRYKMDYSSPVRPGVEAFLGTFGAGLASCSLMIDHRMPLEDAAPIIWTTAILPQVLLHSGPLHGALTLLSTDFCSLLFYSSSKFSKINERFLQGCALLFMGGVAWYQNNPMAFVSSLIGAYCLCEDLENLISGRLCRWMSGYSLFFFLGNLNSIKGLSNFASFVTCFVLEDKIPEKNGSLM